MSPLRTCVFPCAGFGTRFFPATKVIPKEMLPLVDKPLIQHAVEEARAAGVEKFIFVTSRGKGALDDHFDINYELNDVLRVRGKWKELEQAQATEMPSNTLFVTRQQQPLGLGHAVWCARQFIGDEPFAVLLPDDVVLHDRPCLAQMVDAYEQVGGNMVAVLDVPREQTSRYGILDVASDSGNLVKARGLVEKPKPEEAPSTTAIFGRYILQPEIFKILDRHERGAGGEIQLTDAMTKLMADQEMHGFRFQGRRFDCGDKVGFLQANIAFALRRPDLADKVRAGLADIL